MNGVFRVSALLAFAALVAALPIRAEEPLPCKNHYILRCEPDDLGLLWEPVAEPPFPIPRSHTATLMGDGRVLVVGGPMYAWDDVARVTRLYYAGAQTFDPSTGAWAPTAPMNEQRAGHQAVRLADGRVLVVGGSDFNQRFAFVGSAEIFDPADGTWTPTGSVHDARGAFSATLLGDGRVLMVGGVDQYDGTVASAEIYDPATGAWRFTAPPAEPRLVHTATALRDGRVLVVGGMTDDFFMWTTGSAEVFDPSTETWASAGSVDARWLHTATLTESGEVLVAGGYISAPTAGSQGWYVARDVTQTATFDPVKGEWRDTGRLAMPRFRHLAISLRTHGVLLFGGMVSTGQIPAYRAEVVERYELNSLVDREWRVIESRDERAVPADSYQSATELADGSVLFLGDRPGAQAARLRY